MTGGRVEREYGYLRGDPKGALEQVWGEIHSALAMGVFSSDTADGRLAKTLLDGLKVKAELALGLRGSGPRQKGVTMDYALVTRQPGASPEVNVYSTEGANPRSLEEAGKLLSAGAEPPMTFVVVPVQEAKWDSA